MLHRRQYILNGCFVLKQHKTMHNYEVDQKRVFWFFFCFLIKKYLKSVACIPTTQQVMDIFANFSLQNSTSLAGVEGESLWASLSQILNWI